MKLKKFLSLLVALAMLFSCVSITAMAEGSNVAKVGNTEYASIDEAIANWTNGTTLTLLSDVTLTDVVALKSTEHHILDLGTYTMTAASGKNAFVIQACGTGSAERSTITINADATNPGGINAGNKCVVYYKYADGGISTEDRPIIKINGGIFTGSTSSYSTAGIYTIGTAARKCATLNISGGTFNCSINGSGKSKLIISGGTFNYSVASQGDSTCSRLISGGTFKSFGFMTADSNNTKFWIGTSMGNSNVGAYIDDNGYLVVGGPVIEEAGENFEASSPNHSNAGFGSYLTYSSVATKGIYYTSVEEALADNNKTNGSVTVYVDELDMTNINYKGTIVVPEGEEITIIVEENTTPTWTVAASDDAVTYTDDAGNVLEKNESGSFVEPDPGEINADVIVEGVDAEIVPVDGVDNSYEITLADGEIWTEGTSVTMTFPAVEGAADDDFAYVVHEHEGVSYIYIGKVADGRVTITNTVGFSTFTVYEGDMADALAAASTMTGDVTVEIYDKVTLNKSLTGSYDSIKFVGKDTDAEIYLDVQGYIEASGKDVAFESLTLSKSSGGFITNAGFMNVAFGVYHANSVSYTDCIFTNGAYASSGKNTFTDCTFYRSHDKYGLWAYGSDDIVVDRCTFADYRGIKMYDENKGANNTTVLTVKNTDFSAVTDKPAIVLTYGESVTLEKNTYSSTGVFELDLGGAPNGTPVTSDIAPTCKNDNGACGVLVDGKIYTTVAQAAEVAKEGSTVTLLHDSAETVEFAEGVILDKNGFEAAGVTVIQAGLSGEGTEEEPYLINDIEDLKWFRDDVNSGNDYYGKFVKLTAGIDLNDEEWTPIAYNGKTFKGNFDGGNNTVKNLKITKELVNSSVNNGIGFFGRTDDPATICNLTIENVDITGSLYVGAVVGHGYTGKKIENCTVKGDIAIDAWWYAGVIGGNGYMGLVNNCHVIGNDNSYIKGNGGSYIGGIWGFRGENAHKTTNCTVTNLSITGVDRVGGISGISHYGNIISDCSAKDVTITATDPEATTVGLIVGACQGTESEPSVFEGNTVENVTAKAGDSVVTGLYGTNINGSVPVTNYVAEVNGVGYETLEEAFTAANTGDTVTLLADVTPSLISQRAITKADVIDLNGNTLTLTEDDLYFGTTTFKNGNIVVDPSVKPSTAVFWMFANQTLSFDNVKLTATGVTGTYLIGLDGDNSDLNLLNGSEIIVSNATPLDLDIICVNASTGNDIVIDNSKVNVTNLDGRVFFRGNYTVSGNSDINLSDITKAGFRIEAGQTLKIEDTATVDISGEPRDGGIHITDVTATYTVADTATVNATVNAPVKNVAEINGVGYATLAEAVAEAKAGDEIVLLTDVTENVTVPAGVIFNGNGKQVGTITAAGEITFKGHTKATNFGTQYTNTTINIGEGACLEITGTDRLVVGHGCTFNIIGTITDAKTANVADLTPSLIIPGASFTGAGVNFNVKNAYIKTTASYCSSSKSASGTFDFNIENSIWEQFGKLAFESQSTAATVNFDLKDSVLTTTSHLVFGVSRGEVVIDNSNVNVGTSRQIENQSTMTIKNGSVVNGAVATSSNAKNPGTLILENATYSVTGEFSGSDVGTGTIVIKDGASFTAGKITNANIQINATNMSVGDEINLTADLSGLTGTVEVVNNNGLVADIVDGKIVLSAKPAPTGTVTPAYTSATTIWGEATGNASESFAIKLYSDDTLLVTATLNDPEGAIIDGNIENVTWNIPLNNAGADSWWTVEWTKYITAATQPTKVVAVVDGVEVAENTYKLNSPDDLNKIYAAVADADGKFTAYYTDVQEAIVAVAPAGTVEILADVTVDEWVMIAESLTIGNDDLITCVIDGLTINGNNHTLTINSIESAGNGGRMFFDATNLNINNLNIVLNNGTNGIGLQSGTLSNVSFVGGGYGVLPQDGNITITGCTFETNSTAIYYEEERDNLVVTECTFNQPDDVNVILLRGDTTFTNNTVNSGRTVNVVSGSPVVSGNDFNNVRLKVYTAAEATISENEINVLAFEDGATTQNSAFSNNTMSTEAQAALEAMTPSVAASGEVAYRAYIEDSESREAIKVDLQNVYATSSVVVKLYDAEGNLLITTTLKAGGKEAEYLTTNIVLSGTASSSWDTVINAEKLTVANVPTKVELWIDGSLLDTFEPALGNATDAAPYQLPAYLALDSVYKEAKIGDTYYATLAEAFAAATEGCTITLLDNITVSEAWDCRYNGAKFTVPVTIDGNGKTLKLTGAVNDMNWNTVFRFEADATVKNLTIDASEASDIQRGISAKSNITVENSTFIGNGTTAKRAIIYGEGAGTAESAVTATISGCIFKDWSYGVSDSQSGRDSKSVSIADSTFTNASVLVSAAETITFTGNTVADGYVNITSYTSADTVSVTATGNNLEGTDDVIQVNPDNVTADDSFITPIAKIGSKYYETLSKAVKKAKEGDTVQLLAGTISEGTIKLPATLKNVTIKGADNKATTLKDTTIMAADGDSLEYDGLTFDGIIFDNSNIIMTGWRTSAAFKNITVTNCEFSNYSNDKNNAAVHLNIADNEAAENLVFTNNTVEGLSGSQVAALYATTAGETTITGNIVKNVQGNGFTVHVAGGTTTIKENTIENWANDADEGRAMRISFAKGAEDASAVVNDNVMIKENAPEEFVKITGIESNSVNIDKNYWNGFSPVDEGIINVEGYTVGKEVSNYYNDKELTNLVLLNGLFEFYAASPVLSNSLAIDFYVEMSNFDGDGYYAEIEHDTANGVVSKTIPMDSWTPNGSYYLIRYNDITAKQITETMYITIYDENGNQVSERREDGVKAYAERQLAKETTSAKLKTTLVDMLNYGAAAQKQFGYRTDMLANVGLTEEQKSYASDMPELINEREFDAEKCGGTSLVLKDNIKLDVYFKGIKEGMYATATYTKHNESEPRTYEFTYDDFVANGSYNVLTLGTLVIADAKQLVTITVYNEDGTVYTTYKDSMNSYLARQLTNGDAESDIYTMTAKFTASAHNVLH